MSIFLLGLDLPLLLPPLIAVFDLMILALVLVICLPLPVAGLLLPDPPEEPPPLPVPPGLVLLELHNNQDLGCKNFTFLRKNSYVFLGFIHTQKTKWK